MSNNYVVLVGNLGADVEMRYTPSGVPVANLRLATTDRWEKNGQKQERTEWHRCVLWNKVAEKAAEEFRKGSFVKLSGSLRTRSWNDREGNKRYVTEVHVFKAELIKKKVQEENAQMECPF
jgi:single-strand DNA-binding protein